MDKFYAALDIVNGYCFTTCCNLEDCSKCEMDLAKFSDWLQEKIEKQKQKEKEK